MRPVHLTVLAVLYSFGACAAWPAQRLDSQGQLMTSDREDGAQLSKHVRDRLQGDCQMSAARALQVSCSEAQAEGVADHTKQDVAISLTLCSIHSAIQKPPDECDAWLRDPLDVHLEPPRDDNGRGRCLNALHRSPQDWSTYNIYLSDATQLCHAISGRYRAQLVQLTYQNITEEKVALLRNMQEAVARRDEEARGLDRQWQSRLDNLQDRLEALDHLQDRLGSSLQSAEAGRLRMAQVMSQYEERLPDFWSAMQGAGEKALESIIQSGETALHSAIQEVARRLDTTLAEDQQRHARHLQLTAESVAAQLGRAVSKVEIALSATDASLRARDLQQESAWNDFSGEIGALHEVAVQAGLKSLDLSNRLLSGLAAARSLEVVHLGLASSSQQVSASLNDIRITASSLSSRLNQTMLLLNEFHSQAWWTPSSMLGDAMALVHLLSSLALLLMVLQALRSLGAFSLVWWLARYAMRRLPETLRSTCLLNQPVSSTKASVVQECVASLGDTGYTKPSATRPYHPCSCPTDRIARVPEWRGFPALKDGGRMSGVRTGRSLRCVSAPP